VRRQDEGKIWTAPRVFSLGALARRSFLRSMFLLRNKIGVKRQHTVLDFSATEKMSAEGALLFLAELRRLIWHVKGGVEVGCILPHNNKVAQVLKQIGVLDLLSVSSSIVPVDDDVINWRTAHGRLVLGEKYDDILEHYDGAIAEVLQDKLYTGITEAMTNVINHAYDLERDDGLDVKVEKDWWMFSQQMNGFLTIVFCDLGAGIPRTLPAKRASVWRKILKGGRTSDADVIKFAAEDSVSRTRKEYRGKGLGQIVRVVSGLPQASVQIFSNRGVYSVTGGSKQSASYGDSILGTLIFWRIPLPVKEAV